MTSKKVVGPKVLKCKLCGAIASTEIHKPDCKYYLGMHFLDSILSPFIGKRSHTNIHAILKSQVPSQPFGDEFKNKIDILCAEHGYFNYAFSSSRKDDRKGWLSSYGLLDPSTRAMARMIVAQIINLDKTFLYYTKTLSDEMNEMSISNKPNKDKGDFLNNATSEIININDILAKMRLLCSYFDQKLQHNN